MVSRLSPSHGLGNMAAVRCVEADAYAAATANGVGIDLMGKRGALFILSVGTLGTNANVDAYIQDSADNSTFANVTGLSFTTVTASDGAGQALAYNSGANRYVRAVLVVNTATSDAGIAAVTF